MEEQWSNEQVAQVCYEANRAFCESIGDNSQPAWADAPEWQKQSAISGVQFHRDAVERGEKPSPAASHEAWLEQKRRDGWAYGPTKDTEKKLHPCFVAYELLPAQQRRKDYIFAGIVEAFYHSFATTMVAD